MSRGPCIAVCLFDCRTGWCLGCGRSLDEGQAWRDLGPEALAAVTGDLPRRLAVLESLGRPTGIAASTAEANGDVMTRAAYKVSLRIKAQLES